MPKAHSFRPIPPGRVSRTTRDPDLRWVQLKWGPSSLVIYHDIPKTREGMLKLVGRYFKRTTAGKELYFRATYTCGVSPDGRSVELRTVVLTDDIWQSVIGSETVDGIQILYKEEQEALDPPEAEPRTIDLEIRHVDPDIPSLRVKCQPKTLWRDITDAFCRQITRVAPYSKDMALVWWAHPNGLHYCKEVGEYLTDTNGPETIYIVRSQADGTPFGKPVLNIWAAQPNSIKVNITLAPQWEFASLYPIAPLTDASPESGTGQSIEWHMFTRGGQKLLDEETGLELTSLSWETRVKGAPGNTVPRGTLVTSSTAGPAAFDPLVATLSDSDSVLLRLQDMIPYLNASLTALGLSNEIRVCFIRYFLPAFVRNEYIALRFVPQEAYSQAAKLVVDPTPDVIVRIYMIFKGISSEEAGGWVQAYARAQEPANRWREIVGLPADNQLDNKKKFRILEWGGMEALT